MTQTELVRHEQSAVVTNVERDSGGSLMDVIAQAARDPSVDVLKMQQLLEMSERLQARQAEIAFSQAMARLQPRLPRISKKGRIEFTDRNGAKQATPFARYEDISGAVKPLLAQEGFTVSFGVEPHDKGGILVACTLSHREGHSKTISMPVPIDTSGAKNNIQGAGSSLTYGRRYTLCAMLDIVTEGEDTDGATPEYLTDEEIGHIEDMLAACEEWDKGVRSRFLKAAKVGAISEIQRAYYEKHMKDLRVKLQRLRGESGAHL